MLSRACCPITSFHKLSCISPKLLVLATGLEPEVLVWCPSCNTFVTLCLSLGYQFKFKLDLVRPTALRCYVIVQNLFHLSGTSINSL